ncbi:MAG: Ig-like domain-containing protein, partial [Verrucomicrobiota bacterium]|nr:Ig-like domain-containing protein [Verrucomicrobiota bacterium]
PSTAAPPRQFALRWTPDPADANKAAVEVSGLSVAALKDLEQSHWTPAQWQRLLSVYAGQGDLAVDIGLPAMLGTYRVESGILRFEPQFPLEPGVSYRAMFHPGRLPGESGTEGIISARFELPARRSRQTSAVRAIYPSADVLPENLLKFYIHFSAPMSRGHIYDHIHLRDDTGKAIELPFLEIDEELWDPAMTRLTLFIDPGRIKRGVLPLEEVGPALEAGKRYALEIDQAWKDGAGNPLQASFRKVFRVGSPDRDPPDPAQWKVQAPTPETRAPLAITFPEPLDHALAQRLIRVTGESGEGIEGKTALENQERHWSFVPTRPWRRGAYHVVIQTTIEDLAGNNIGKPFEVDVVERVQPRLTRQSVKLAFEVR